MKRGLFRRLLDAKVPQYALALGLLGFVLVRAWEPPEGGFGLRRLITDHLATGQVGSWPLAESMVLLFLAVSLTICRWHILLKALGLGMPARETARLGWIGFYFNTLLPGSIGGDLVKATVVARRFPGRRLQGVATVLLDRGFALWNLFLFVSLVSLALPPRDPTMIRLGFMARVVCAGTLALWWILGFLPLWRAERFALRLRRWFPGAGMLVGELWLALFRFRQNPGIILLAVAISGVSQAAFILSVVEVGRGLRLDLAMPTAESHYLLVPMAMMINAFPLFPGGLGIGEWGYGTLYGLMGAEPGAGVAVSLGHRAATWVLAGLSLVGISLAGRRMGRTGIDNPREPVG